jgi:RNA polymerase sigma-70 factor (ECF subfamily)
MMQLEFQRIVEEFTPDLYWLAYSYCMNRSDAEDVVQEVLLKYLQHRPQCAGRRQLRAWLMTATANKCKNLLNSAWRRRTLPLEDVHASPDHSDEVLEVREALAKLPPELRGVVHLYYFERLKTKEIAALLSLSETAVRSRLHRARKRLKTLLGGE